VITKVTVTLSGLSHTYSDDIGVLLVSPSRKKIRLMSDVGGAADRVNDTLTFDDAAASSLPDAAAIVAGSYRPTQGTVAPDGAGGAPTNWPAPAPASPYSLLLSDLNGDSPYGTWSLYVIDDDATQSGSVTGGWSLTVTTIDAPIANGDTASTMHGTAVVIPVLDNDSDSDGTLDPATVAVASGPTGGDGAGMAGG
jgi:subtilisin-like proprotein convertase family protein